MKLAATDDIPADDRLLDIFKTIRAKLDAPKEKGGMANDA